MQERSWQRSYNLKPVALPQPYRALIRTHHKIELHGAKSSSGGPRDRIAAHRARHAASCCSRRRHIPAIAYMSAAALLICAKDIGADNSVLLLRNEYRIARGVPICQSLSVRKRTRQCVCFARTNHRLKDGPYVRVVVGASLPDGNHLEPRFSFSIGTSRFEATDCAPITGASSARTR